MRKRPMKKIRKPIADNPIEIGLHLVKVMESHGVDLDFDNLKTVTVTIYDGESGEAVSVQGQTQQFVFGGHHGNEVRLEERFKTYGA